MRTASVVAVGLCWLACSGSPSGNDAGVDAGCVPACGTRTCGTEPSCGTSCGSCNGGLTCSMTGTCEAPGPLLLTNGADNDDAAFGVATDANGFSYVTGYFANGVNFGDDRLVSMAPRDVFISKIAADGKYVWARAIKGTGTKQAQSLAVDSGGAVFVSGFFSGQAIFGSKTVTAAGSRDLFVTKLTSEGDFVWTFTAGAAGSEVAGRVAVAPSGNIYVAGNFSGTVAFGTHSLTSTMQSSDVMVLRLSAEGVPAWAVRAGGKELDEARGVAVTSPEGVAIGGTYGDTAAFGTHMLTTKGFAGAFAAKLDADGAFSWASGCQSTSAQDFAFGWAMHMDLAQNIYVAGQVAGQVSCGTHSIASNADSDDAYVVKFAPPGTIEWAKAVGGSGADVAWTVAIEGNGNGVLGGEFEGAGTFGTAMATAKGTSDAFIARFDGSGNFSKVDTVGATGASSLTFGLAWLPWGRPIAVGAFGGNASFGTAMRMAAGGSDFFVWTP